MTLSPAQCRAARALIEMTQEDLAGAAHVGISTIRSFEAGTRSPHINNLLAIARALAEAGVVLVPTSTDGGIGVRLKAEETAAGLTREIKALEADLASCSAVTPKSPKGGMQRLEKAHKREAVTKLKNRRTKLVRTKT